MKSSKLLSVSLTLTIACGMVTSYTTFQLSSCIIANADDYTEVVEGDLTFLVYPDHADVYKCARDVSGKISIPDRVEGVKVTGICKRAFMNCTNLKEIIIPESVEHFGAEAFWATEWLRIKLKENPLLIINNVLVLGQGCSGDVLIPDGITRIEEYAFYGCHKEYSVNIPDSVKSIGNHAFGSSNLESIQLNNSITSIEDYTFCDTYLSSIIIPDSVTSIGEEAFSYNSKLKAITLPSSVQRLGKNALTFCEKLESVCVMNPECVIPTKDTICNVYSTANKSSWYYGKIIGYKSSTAEEFANTYNYTFEALEGEPPVTKRVTFGDPNGDGKIDANDASLVLVEYSKMSTGAATSLTSEQTTAADVNKDGKVDSKDASAMLAYYSYLSTGGDNDLEVFLSKQ